MATNLLDSDLACWGLVRWAGYTQQLDSLPWGLQQVLLQAGEPRGNRIRIIYFKLRESQDHH